jgi:Fuc2NAc and GlcNAc transferase
MTPPILVVAATVVFLAALVLTGLVRRYALAANLLDVPNSRSSHTRVTPRGGGLAIVAALLAGLVILAGLRVVPSQLAWAALIGGGLVAATGFLDDRGHVHPALRLAAHFAAAGVVLVALGGLPPLPVFGGVLDLGWPGQLLAAVYIVWLINLTNFMDGTDGIAAVQGVTVPAGAAAAYVLAGSPTGAVVGPLLLSAAALGFLPWNWAPARIFMGDVGSGFLGLAFGALSIHAAWVDGPLFWVWVILMGVFVVDATTTLVRRVARGETFHEAHRSHAYQHAARRYSHRTVATVTAAVNLLWLLPVAMLVALGVLGGATGVIIAYAPLLGFAIHFGAGAPEAVAA